MNDSTVLGLFAALTLNSLASGTPQCPEWSNEYNTPGVNGSVMAQLKYDDGSGEKLYVGGDFTTAGKAACNSVAVWDGTSWSALGAGPGGEILSLAFYDSGAGEMLWAGGANALHYFDGSTWTSIPTVGEVRDMHVFDDGNGPALFICGTITSVAGTSVGRLARFDGSWSNMLGGTSGSRVNAFATYDDGSGPALYFGGKFTTVGGVPLRSVGRWDGTTFSQVGSGVELTEPVVTSLLVYDDGLPGGPALYAGGVFGSLGGVSSSNWARYSALDWEALPSGMTGVRGLTVQRKTGGDVLWAMTFTLFSWDGVTLSQPTPALVHDFRSVSAYGPGFDEDVYVGTDFMGYNMTNHGAERNPLMRWDGSSWKTASPGNGIGMRFNVVRSTTIHDFGDGPELIAGGKFFGAGGESTPLVARFDGTRWAAIGDNLSGWGIEGLVSFDGDLYAAGDSGGVNGSARIAARFNGTNWQGLGPEGSSAYETLALATFDDGTGPALYAAGDFFVIGSEIVNNIVKGNGSGWEALGTGLEGGEPWTEGTAFAIYDDGTGPALYVAGRFDTADGVAASHIARWDGQNWSPLGAGLQSSTIGSPPCVYSLTTWNSPSGSVLVATGYINAAGGAPVNNIALWDGTSWSALGTGLTAGPTAAFGRSMTAFDPDGTGEKLYVVGGFTSAGGLPCDGFAMWDGTSWSVPAAVDGEAFVVDSYDDGEGRALFMGGSFAQVDGIVSTNIARFSDACGNDLGYPRCTSLPNSSGQRALLRADGTASLSAATIDMQASRLPAGQLTLLFNGTDSVQAFVGDGVLCVTNNVKRMYPAGNANGSGEYSVALDFGAPYAVNFLPGTTLLFQGWYRDFPGGPAGFNTTDALEITFRP